MGIDLPSLKLFVLVTSHAICKTKKIKNIENITVKKQLYECFDFQMKQKSVSILFCKKELSDQFLARSDKHKIDCGYQKYKQHLKCCMALFFFRGNS